MPPVTVFADVNVYFQYGVEIDLPAATILSTFGLRAQVRTVRLLCLVLVLHLQYS